MWPFNKRMYSKPDKEKLSYLVGSIGTYMHDFISLAEKRVLVLENLHKAYAHELASIQNTNFQPLSTVHLGEYTSLLDEETVFEEKFFKVISRFEDEFFICVKYFEQEQERNEKQFSVLRLDFNEKLFIHIFNILNLFRNYLHHAKQRRKKELAFLSLPSVSSYSILLEDFKKDKNLFLKIASLYSEIKSFLNAHSNLFTFADGPGLGAYGVATALGTYVTVKATAASDYELAILVALSTALTGVLAISKGAKYLSSSDVAAIARSQELYKDQERVSDLTKKIKNN